MYFAFSLLVCFLTTSYVKGCGNKPPGARIVGGEEAPPHSWPWQLSLRRYGRHHCGASLLNKNWALTAAHCVDEESNPARYALVLGAHKRTNDGKVLSISRIIMHPRWRRSTFSNDVAVLKLSRSATLGSKINTICLPSQGSRVPLGTTCYVTGWGRISSTTSDLATKLKQAKAPLVSHSQCVKTNGPAVLKPSMVCVGGQGSSICNGDSGGPLSCLEGGRWVVRGVASWVTSLTCPGDKYSVYARVSTYVDWISSYVQGGGRGVGVGGSRRGGKGVRVGGSRRGGKGVRVGGNCKDTWTGFLCKLYKVFFKCRTFKARRNCKKTCNLC